MPHTENNNTGLLFCRSAVPSDFSQDICVHVFLVLLNIYSCLATLIVMDIAKGDGG